MDVQQSDPAPQQQAPTRVADRATEHTIRFETWVGYNSTWKYFQVRGASIYVQILSAMLTRTRASSSPDRCGRTAAAARAVSSK